MSSNVLPISVIPGQDFTLSAKNAISEVTRLKKSKQNYEYCFDAVNSMTYQEKQQQPTLASRP